MRMKRQKRICELLEPCPTDGAVSFAIRRLDRELQKRALEAGPMTERTGDDANRIFPLVTKAYWPMRDQEQGYESSEPIRIGFPDEVTDAEEWSKRCQVWSEQHERFNIESSDP